MAHISISLFLVVIALSDKCLLTVYITIVFCLVVIVLVVSVKTGVVLELIFLNLAWMLALSIPMAVLVATLLTFGRLTADSEIIAIKSSGINLMRILFPLLIAAGVLTYGMIEFHDKILPELNHKARLLTGDIRSMRPTLTFRPGRGCCIFAATARSPYCPRTRSMWASI